MADEGATCLVPAVRISVVSAGGQEMVWMEVVGLDVDGPLLGSSDGIAVGFLDGVSVGEEDGVTEGFELGTFE